MGWSSPDEDSRADHYRDERKHDFPLHAEPKPMTTAMEIAVCIRGMANITHVAELIQQYADMVAAGARCEQHKESTDRILKSLETPR